MTAHGPRGFDAALSIGLAPAVGAFVHAIANAVAIRLQPSGAGLSLAFSHHVFDFAFTWGLGCFASAVLLGAMALERGLSAMRPTRRIALAAIAYMVALTWLCHEVLGRLVRRQAELAFEGEGALVLYGGLLALCGIGGVSAHVLSAMAGRSGRLLWMLPCVAVGLGLIVVNQIVYPDDYPELHAGIGWTGILFVGGVLAVPLAARCASVRGRRIAVACIALPMLSVFVHPDNAVRLELFRYPGAFASWGLAAGVWRLPALPTPTNPASREGSTPPRATERPPTPGPRPEHPIVLLITVDALRADVIEAAEHDERFPTLARMKRVGTMFTQARTPGSQTSVSLATMFSGRYFSELEWAYHGRGSTRFLYPAADESLRFPQILSDAGVRTVSYASLNFLADEFGISRGFSEQTVVPTGRRHAVGRELIDPLLGLLAKRLDGGLFFHTHLMEPHYPYDRGTLSEGSEQERYLSEIEVVDRLLGRVLRRVRASDLTDRTYVIVTADHGEAFGEHGTTKHTKTLYEELIRVPLLVLGPGVATQRVDVPVSLIDLGPTIVDLFGLTLRTPMHGASLVPILQGARPVFERSILAEGRGRRAIVSGRFKAIVDLRRKVVEVYDLERDPLELDNLFGMPGAPGSEALAELQGFFERHGRPGPPPYKP